MSPTSVAILLVAVAAASAVPLRVDSEVRYPGYLHESAYEDSKPMARNLDSIGGGNLLRDINGGVLRAFMYPPRDSRLDALSGGVFGSSKRFDPMRERLAGEKRNGLDEIERSGFDSFIKKKNFDEIDRSGFDGFVKRNFDEIDRAGFNGFVKRGVPARN